MGQDRPINALLPGFAQVHVFNSTRIKPSIPVYMPITMYLGVFAQNTPRSRVSACFHLPQTALTALHVLSKCQTRVRPVLCVSAPRSSQFLIKATVFTDTYPEPLVLEASLRTYP